MQPTQAAPQRWYDAEKFNETHHLIQEALQQRSRLVNLAQKLDSVDDETLPTFCKDAKECLYNLHNIWDEISDSLNGKMYVPFPPPIISISPILQWALSVAQCGIVWDPTDTIHMTATTTTMSKIS